MGNAFALCRVIKFTPCDHERAIGYVAHNLVIKFMSREPAGYITVADTHNAGVFAAVPYHVRSSGMNMSQV
jgi:hypothetical protein